MKKIKRSDLSIENYQVLDGKLLISPFKQMKFTTEVNDFEPELGKDGKEQLDEQGMPLMKRVKKKTQATYEYQLAEVISASPNSKYKSGDTVVYSIKFVKEFDLFKNTFLINEYDVFGLYKD